LLFREFQFHHLLQSLQEELEENKKLSRRPHSRPKFDIQNLRTIENKFQGLRAENKKLHRFDYPQHSLELSYFCFVLMFDFLILIGKPDNSDNF
jgi:hypothetical protein